MLNQKAKIGYQMCIKTENIRCILIRNNAVSSVNQLLKKRGLAPLNQGFGDLSQESPISVVLNIIFLVAAKEIFRLMITPAISQTLGVEEVQKWAEVTL